LKKKENQEMIKSLEQYIRETFGDEIMKRSTYDTRNYPDRHYYLPEEITEEQAWKIREITGLKFFEIIEVKEEGPTFWAIKLGDMIKSENWYTVEVGKSDPSQKKMIYKMIPMVFTSQEEAHEALKEGMWLVFNGLPEEGIYGTLEELSDTPNILKSFIEQEDKLDYDEINHRIVNLRRAYGEKLLVLNSLLKNRIAEVVPFPIEDVIDLDTDWWPIT
jgi:hypothetical protein